jgi:hypothetical protein
MALRFLGESDRRLNDLRPIMSIIPDDPFAATAGSQMATRTRIAAERVQRPARPPASTRGNSRRKSAGFLVAINLYRDRHRRRAGPS